MNNYNIDAIYRVYPHAVSIDSEEGAFDADGNQIELDMALVDAAAIEVDAENILKWRHLIENNNDLLRNPYWGYEMLDPDGKLFGYWLSYERRTVIKMSKDNKLQVYTPDVRTRAREFEGGTN